MLGLLPLSLRLARRAADLALDLALGPADEWPDDVPDTSPPTPPPHRCLCDEHGAQEHAIGCPLDGEPIPPRRRWREPCQ